MSLIDGGPARLARRVVPVAVAALFVGLFTLPTTAAQAATNFQLPFPCGERWQATTYYGENGEWVSPIFDGVTYDIDPWETPFPVLTSKNGCSGGSGYGVWDTVNVRASNPACATSPGTTNCPTVIDTLNPGDQITPSCQKPGQTVGSNPYWVYGTTPRARTGWMASWYVDYPNNVVPGVPGC